MARVGVGLGSFLTISFLTIATLVFLAELTLWLAGDATRPVGGEFVGIRHRSIFGSREPGVPREVVAMA